MKKNQERRLHRKNAKIVKEGGTPMTLSRPIKPDTTVSCFSRLFFSGVLGSRAEILCGDMTACLSSPRHVGHSFFPHLLDLRYTMLIPSFQRRCGHCGQMGHMKTNRKCPRWAEFNSGAPPPTPSSATAAAASATSPPPGGLGFGGFSVPAVPSPLATSPPLTGMD